MQIPEMLTPEELGRRMDAAMLGGMETLCLYIGDQLGFYRLLHRHGSSTAASLAAHAGTNERQTREWLEQQTMAGVIFCENPEAEGDARRFSLPAAYAPLLLEPESMALRTPAAQLLVAMALPMPQLLEAFRSGQGVPYAAYGERFREGMARINRPGLTQLLTQEWLAAMPDVVARLQADPPARIADIGVGQGWSSITLARAFPRAFVDGLDLDTDSIAAARQNAQSAFPELADRLTFHLRDAGDPALAGQYDLALAIECIHDMPRPVAVLAAMRQLVGPGGTVLIVDERVHDAFTPDGSEEERMVYGYSVLHCLPVGMAEQPSVATGAVMRRATFHGYAQAAGYTAVVDLPIAYDGYRFYRLTA